MPELRQTSCPCAKSFCVVLGRVDEYERAKDVLNAGRHPTFVGRDMVSRNARNGGLLFFCWHGKDVAVALLDPKVSNLLVLNVHPMHRGHGLGRAAVRFVAPNFVRALESRVAFFESLGYCAVGSLKQGKTLQTQIMVRKDLLDLAGRWSRFYLARAKTQGGQDALAFASSHSNQATADVASEKVVKLPVAKRA